jgi:hypothetical protein
VSVEHPFNVYVKFFIIIIIIMLELNPEVLTLSLGTLYNEVS